MARVHVTYPLAEQESQQACARRHPAGLPIFAQCSSSVARHAAMSRLHFFLAFFLHFLPAFAALVTEGRAAVAASPAPPSASSDARREVEFAARRAMASMVISLKGHLRVWALPKRAAAHEIRVEGTVPRHGPA